MKLVLNSFSMNWNKNNFASVLTHLAAGLKSEYSGFGLMVFASITRLL